MRVLRYEIPIDDQAHMIRCGEIVHVDCRSWHSVEIWAFDEDAYDRAFRVFGTGHEIPQPAPGAATHYWYHAGTALSPHTARDARGSFVWHLFELIANPERDEERASMLAPLPD